MGNDVLGIDLGASKIKLCALREDGRRRLWRQYSVPFTPSLLPDRGADFEAGMATALDAFCAEWGSPPTAFCRVEVGTSHFLNYPDFRRALLHTIALLDQQFPAVDCRLVGAEGKSYPLSEALALADAHAVRFLDTTFRGMATLAAGRIADGVAIDLGSQSSDLVGIRGGQVDPQAAADPDAYCEGRPTSGRFLWLGTLTTPLDHLAPEIVFEGRRQVLLPHQADTGCLVSILGLLPFGELLPHALLNQVFPRERALIQLAHALGTDVRSCTEPRLEAIATLLFDRLLSRIGSAARQILEELYLDPRASGAVVVGLGAPIARRALEGIGIPGDRIVDLEDEHGDLGNFASAFGLASLAGLFTPVQRG